MQRFWEIHELNIKKQTALLDLFESGNESSESATKKFDETEAICYFMK